jgi:hypothetical protein
VLRRISGPKRGEMIGCWRKLHDEQLHIFYSLPNIIKNDQVKEEEMGRDVARMGENRNAYKESQRERDHQEELDVGGRILLKLVLDRMLWYGLESSGSG